MNAPQPYPPKMSTQNQFAPTLPRTPRHGLFWSPQCVNDDIHHCTVAIVDHLERITPTGWLVLLALSHVRSRNRCHLPIKVEILGHRNPDGHSTSDKGTPTRRVLGQTLVWVKDSGESDPRTPCARSSRSGATSSRIQGGDTSTLNPCLCGGRQ